MAGGSTLFLRPRSDGLLRDSLSWECLQDYMKQYGDVTSVWLPWKDGDRRYFGFVTFKDSNAAKQAVDASPHMIDAVEVLCDFKRNKQNSPAAHTLAAAPPPTAEKMDLLERSSSHGRRILHPQQRIEEEWEPAHAERLRLSQELMFGGPTSSEAPRMPIVLFHGPPGTGKTHAMRVLAATAHLQPWRVSAKKLQEDSYQAASLWRRTLDHLDKLNSAIVFIDECEVLFPRTRGV